MPCARHVDAWLCFLSALNKSLQKSSQDLLLWPSWMPVQGWAWHGSSSGQAGCLCKVGLGLACNSPRLQNQATNILYVQSSLFLPSLHAKPWCMHLALEELTRWLHTLQAVVFGKWLAFISMICNGIHKKTLWVCVGIMLGVASNTLGWASLACSLGVAPLVTKDF